MKRAPLYRILTLLVILLCCAIAKKEGWLDQIDHALAAKRMAVETMPASGQIALLEIDNKSLTAIGVWPWKRSIYADIIEKSFAAGAEELAFDIDFSSNSTRAEDEAFASALEDAEGPVTLAVFQQFATSQIDEHNIRYNHPIEPLATRAWLATVNVIADPDGYVRTFPLAQTINGELFPSLTSTLGGYQNIVESRQIINFNIDPKTIPTYSIIDLLEGTIPADALKNRKVLVGAGAAELRDTMAVPVFGVLSGPQLQIIAAENLLQNTYIHPSPKTWAYWLTLILLPPILFVLLFGKFNTYGRLAGLALLASVVEYLGFRLYSNQHILLETAMVQAIILLTGLATTLSEVGVKSVLLKLSHKHGQSLSDLLDTIVTDSLTGIVIIDAKGRILSISQQAQQLFARFGYNAHKGSQISQSMPWEFGRKIQACLDDPTKAVNGARTNQLEIIRQEGSRYFEFSITPSFIAPDGDELQEENKVVTLLFHDITDSYLEQVRLAYVVDHDPLTNLLNLQGFCNTIDANASDKIPLSGSLALACQPKRLDRVDQMLGPDYSDILLRQIGQSLMEMAEFDCVASINRKIFLVFVEQAKEADIAKLLALLQKRFDMPYDVRGHKIIVGSQIGVAKYDDRTMSGAHDLADAAVIALDRSLNNGDPQSFYSPQLADDVKRQQFLENEILGAFERDEFELFYQPQIDLKTGLTTGCEALARWNHEEMGLIRPDHFIPILEETGKIVDLGRWIMKTACLEAMTWPKPVTVAVNVSAVQFQRSNILDDIEQALSLSGLPRERLHIEITESLFIADSDALIKQLNAIRRNGIKIALDDFGTGYSSLSYIHQFPLDKIKIDRAFVKDLPYSTDSLSVINAVVALARGFDMKIIAEGMENEKQAEALRLAGCHQGQGYYFGKPMRNSNFKAFLAKDHAPRGSTIGPASIKQFEAQESKAS